MGPQGDNAEYKTVMMTHSWPKLCNRGHALPLDLEGIAPKPGPGVNEVLPGQERLEALTTPANHGSRGDSAPGRWPTILWSSTVSNVTMQSAGPIAKSSSGLIHNVASSCGSSY